MTRMFALVLAALAAFGCGEEEPTRGPDVERPAAAVPCPEDAPAAAAFDAREVLGLSEAEASARAGLACTVVVVKRDGESIFITANYDPRRLKVEVVDGVVVRIVGVG